MMGLTAVAEFERSMINERTKEGRELALRKSVIFGRKPKLPKKQIALIKLRRADGKSAAAIAIDLNVSRNSIYRALSQ
ncbi:MAG: DNA invertase Pin-like site-specific DNA recombinase [Granulosicoccus sp.]|jgi:DNA invertase Pin-like site-specific DNA recombinase